MEESNIFPNEHDLRRTSPRPVFQTVRLTHTIRYTREACGRGALEVAEAVHDLKFPAELQRRLHDGNAVQVRGKDRGAETHNHRESSVLDRYDFSARKRRATACSRTTEEAPRSCT